MYLVVDDIVDVVESGIRGSLRHVHVMCAGGQVTLVARAFPVY